MLGSSVSSPYDWVLLPFLVAMAVVLLFGAATAPLWAPAVATVVRRGAVGLAIVAMAVVFVLTPTNEPMVRLGRAFTIWPAFVAAVLMYGVWCWRAGRW